MSYYLNKQNYLERIFGSKVMIDIDSISVLDTGKEYPIIDNVIICDSSMLVEALDVQKSFGDEWEAFNFIAHEHVEEFDRYFDLVALDGLNNKVVCDLGCGMGRWASIMLEKASPDIMVCVDFSDAIYECQKNLKDCDNAIFIKADILSHPFGNDFCDFMYCLGVLHHTTSPALEAVRSLKACSPEFLVYLYYSLDNRSAWYKGLFLVVDIIRKMLCSVKSNRFRLLTSYVIALLVYLPMVLIGSLFNMFGLGYKIPLYEFYRKKSVKRLAQDAYDRFFTSIEQRVSKAEILTLVDTYNSVVVSEGLPLWHFLLKR